MKKIYLDNNATTALDPRVIEAMHTVLKSFPLNPSSNHSFGQKGKQLLISARDTVARVLGVKPNEIIFTSGGTESLNFLIKGFFHLSSFQEAHIITSNVEHPAVNETLRQLEKKGARISYLPVGLWGAVQPDQIEEVISNTTKLIVLTAVNNVTGVKTDIEPIAAIAHNSNIPFVVDGVQLLGKEPFSIPCGVSGMAFSGHKLHAPSGIGIAFLRSDFKIPPLIVGGGQEYGFRGGTENLLGIVGIAKAIDLLPSLASSDKQMKHLTDRLIEGLRPYDIVVHGEGPRICNTAHIGFPGMNGETLLLQLDLLGIAASHGAACSSGGTEPSPVLINMGIAPALAKESLRFSLSRMTTEEEIKTTIDVISQIYRRELKI